MSIGETPANGRAMMLESRMVAICEAPTNARASPAATCAIIKSNDITRLDTRRSMSRARNTRSIWQV